MAPVFRRRPIAIAAAVFMGIVVLFIYVAWRQEIGARRSPLPSSCAGPPTDADLAPTRRVDSAGTAQIWIPPGCFRQGAGLTADFWVANANETPQRDVRITRGFWLDVTEVTNRSFDEFASSGGYRDRSWWSDAGWEWKGGREGPDSPPRDGALEAERPRVWITWFEAEAYTRWRAGRLPSEAEWEYAARGPTPRVYPWGDSWDAERAWTNVTSPTLADRVGLRPLGRTWRGADDLAGNVWEWVLDWYDPDAYLAGPAVDPRGPARGTERVTRGGAWGGPPSGARTTRRVSRRPDQPSLAVGVRVVSDR